VSARVRAILTAPVKGLRAVEREEVELGREGIAEDRRFFVLDGRGRMVNAKRLGCLLAVRADYAHAERTLALELPGRAPLSGVVETGARVPARFFSAEIEALEVRGPWSEALSEHAGEPLTLVETVGGAGAVDRGDAGAFSLISRASIERVGRAAAAGAEIDARRFRMTFEVEGPAAHGEDDWIGVPLAIGSAIVLPHGHVGRCVVTKLDPDSGVRDLETLDALAGYRSGAATTEPLACGIYGVVLEAGGVRVGDAVAPAG
jgi:MOSC domain-containing protein